MPELPEIETIKTGLAPFVKGKTITKVIVRNSSLRWPIPKNISQNLSGQKVENVLRRGKYLLLQTQKGALIIHLGMSGSLIYLNPKTPLKKHDHVDICFDQNFCLRYNDPRRFGCVLWQENDFRKHKLICNLGVEPLSKEFSTNYLFSYAQKSKRPIKLLLMDAKIVVGVGNIYANEALFTARINPIKAANKLSKTDCALLVEEIKIVLKKAIKAGGTSFKDYKNSHGKPGYFSQELLVYGRQNQLCNICKTKLHSLRIGQRITVFCPNCQK